jgi:crotonobetaine/carnitine-CoA ligase
LSYLAVPQAVVAAAERFGNRPALLSESGAESFSELAGRVAGVGEALREAGLVAGERVLLVAENSTATVHAWLGAMHAGAVPAAVNPALTEVELGHLAADLRPRLVIHDGGGAGSADRLGLPAQALEGLDGGVGRLQPHRPDPMSAAAVVYTSGTTSRPKGVMVRHAAYTESGHSFRGWIGLGRQERLWACLPLFHINAQAYSLMSALMHGYGLVISERFHASTFWEEARRLEVTAVNVIGAMLTFLARQPEETWTVSPLRTIYAAPAPTPDDRRPLEDRFRVRITGGYGMSENTFGCAESPTSRDKAGSIGRPRQPASGAFRNELRIVTESGAEAGPGERGELHFRNPVMTPGYWNAKEVTAQTLVGGWLHTGDGGYRDSDGDVFLVGRLKDVIRRRGENISPAEIEEALLSHPEVAAAAVFGVPSELTEEEVVAAVVLLPDASADPEQLRAFARQRLAAFKVPTAIVFKDSLPMTATMRVARDALRAEYLAELSSSTP